MHKDHLLGPEQYGYEQTHTSFSVNLYVLPLVVSQAFPKSIMTGFTLGNTGDDESTTLSPLWSL